VSAYSIVDRSSFSALGHNESTQLDVVCPVGTVVVGGGWNAAQVGGGWSTAELMADRPFAPGDLPSYPNQYGWSIHIKNATPGDIEVEAYAICANAG
jgi:hypothetical protein